MPPAGRSLGGRGCLSDDGGRRSRRRAASTSRRPAVRRPRTRRGAGTQPSGARTCPNPTPRVTTVIARLGGSTSTLTRVFSRPPRISICSGTPENFRLAPARWPARRRRRGRRRTTRCRTGRSREVARATNRGRLRASRKSIRLRAPWARPVRGQQRTRSMLGSRRRRSSESVVTVTPLTRRATSTTDASMTSGAAVAAHSCPAARAPAAWSGWMDHDPVPTRTGVSSSVRGAACRACQSQSSPRSSPAPVAADGGHRRHEQS